MFEGGNYDLRNCYFLKHDDSDNSLDVNLTLHVLSTDEEESRENCYPLDIDQMKGNHEATEDGWAEITVYNGDSLEFESKVSLIDALNDYKLNLYHWTIDNSANNGYPTIIMPEMDIDWAMPLSNGNGEENNPFIISDVKDLEGLAFLVNLEGQSFGDSYLKLSDNFDDTTEMSSQIGYYGFGRYFGGRVDGNGKNIVLNISTNVSSAGLFGNSLGAKIENLTVSGICEGSEYVGGIIGYMNYSTIDNCISNVTIIGGTNVGGIAGYCNESSLTNCTATGSITATDDYVGGIVGYYTYSDSILSCTYSTSTNANTITGHDYVGGIAGIIQAYGTSTNIYNCSVKGSIAGVSYVGGIVGYNERDVIGCSYESVGGTFDVKGQSYVGGVSGNICDDAVVSYTKVKGNVTGENYTGGIAGRSYGGIIEECFVIGNVIATNSYIGGIVGYNLFGTITNSYAICDVTGDEYVGGIAGTSKASDSRAAYILNCYVSGDVSSINAKTTVGKLVGENGSSASDEKNSAFVNYCYGLNGATVGSEIGKSQVSNCVAMTEAVMKGNALSVGSLVNKLNEYVENNVLSKKGNALSVWENGNDEYPTFISVCSINEDKYYTLQIAIWTAQDEDVIKLLVDTNQNGSTISGTKNVTIDLNNHVLRGVQTNTSVIDNYGTLTVCDNSINKTKRYFTNDKCEHGVLIGQECDLCRKCEHGIHVGDTCWSCDGYVALQQAGENGLAKDDHVYETYIGNDAQTENTIIAVGGCITNGNASQGAAFNNDGNLTIVDINIVGNLSKSNGGAIYNTKKLTIKGNTLISGNASGEFGGAIYHYQSILDLYDSTIITNNFSEDGGAVFVGSGGVLVLGGSVKITNNQAGKLYNNLMLLDDSCICFGKGAYVPTNQMKVGLTCIKEIWPDYVPVMFTFSQRGSEAYKDYFTSEVDAYTIKASGKKMMTASRISKDPTLDDPTISVDLTGLGYEDQTYPQYQWNKISKCFVPLNESLLGYSWGGSFDYTNNKIFSESNSVDVQIKDSVEFLEFDCDIENLDCYYGTLTCEPNGNTYHYKFTGNELWVNYGDSFVLENLQFFGANSVAIQDYDKELSELVPGCQYFCTATFKDGSKVESEKLDVLVETVKFAETTNGELAVSNIYATTGTAVTIYTTPASTYVLDTISVTASGGAVVAVDSNNQFTMPSNEEYLPVTVAATFKKNASPVVPSRPATSYYKVNVSSENCIVAVSKSIGAYGEVIYITVTTNDECEFKSIEVTDNIGNKINLDTIIEGSKYSFSMPYRDVNIKASATKKETLRWFVDVPETEYYYDSVRWAYYGGITDGVDETHFAPDNVASRAEMVTFLWRAAGCPQPKNVNCVFTDVKNDTYYYTAVIWAHEKGIAKGTSQTTFSPELLVNRAQAVTFLSRLDGVYNKDLEYTHNFTDVPKDSYYNDAVAWAYVSNITSGSGTDTFSPDENCLRSQIVTFLYRTFNK